MQEISNPQCARKRAEICIEEFYVTMLLMRICASKARHWLTCRQKLISCGTETVKTETDNKNNECNDKSRAIGHQPDKDRQIFLRCDKELHR